MKNWLTQMFGFSKREYNGLLYLLILFFLIMLAPYAYRYYLSKQPQISNNDKVALQKLVLVDEHLARKKYRSFDGEESFSSAKTKAVVYHSFDPNTLDVNGWQQFGLSFKQAMSIVNYVKKGGRFYKPEDLKKMYTISAENYAALLPYVNIAATAKATYTNNNTYTKKEAVVVELNTADTLKLDEIRGVGLGFARRIVKYRERLGGFYNKEQLLEVFGLDSAKFLEIKDQVKIDASAIKKININTAEFDDLKKHPYLKYKEMNAIINYRKQHGNYKSIADLSKVAILSSSTLEKIAPYLSF